MPAAWLAKMKRYEQAVVAAVDDVDRAFTAERRRFGASMVWRTIAAAPLVAYPVLVVVRGCGPPDSWLEHDPSRTPDWQTAIHKRSPVRCDGAWIDLAPIVFTRDDCVPDGCLARRLLPLRRGDRVRMVTGAPEEHRRAWPLAAGSGVWIDRHVMRWVGGSDPRKRDWGEEVARVYPREGSPAEFRAPTSGWFRATLVVPDATPGYWASLCFEIDR
jgi:hypothetical protein